MRGRLFIEIVKSRREGRKTGWMLQTDDLDHSDRSLVERLIARVAYGGRKGRRAFLRLWKLGVRPSPWRLTVRIKGFEMMDGTYVPMPQPEAP